MLGFTNDQIFPKVGTPIHNNDLILIPAIAPQSGWQWTWSCPELHMGGFRDGGWLFWHLGGFTRWNSQFLKYMNFSRHHLSCFTVVPLFLLDKSMAYNRCLQHPCFKKLCKIAQASKNWDSNAQHFLSDLLTLHAIHSMLFALPGYQFPYIVMNRCLYLISVTSWHSEFKRTYYCLGMSMFNSVMRCMPMLQQWSTSWVKCTQMTLDISMLINFFLFHINIRTHDTWRALGISVLNTIFPLHTRTEDYHLKYPNVLL
jgi:hypothetical protein